MDHPTAGRCTQRGLALGVALAALAVLPSAAEAATSATLTPTTAFASANREVGAGPGAARTYTVTSTGSDPLTITGVGLTGGDAGQFRTADDTCARRGPRSRRACTVAVAFDPTATGPRARRSGSTTNVPTLTSAAITGTGRDLGSRRTRSRSPRPVGVPTRTRTVTVTNNDSAPYTLGNVTAPDRPAQLRQGATRAAAPPWRPRDMRDRGPLPPTSPGLKAQTIAIAYYGPAPVTLTGEGGERPRGRSPPTRSSQGRPAAPDARNFTLTNAGTGLSVGQATLPAPTASFSVASDGCSGSTVAPGAECTVAWRSRRRSRLEAASLRFPRARRAHLVTARVEGRAGSGGSDTTYSPTSRWPTSRSSRLPGDGGDTPARAWPPVRATSTATAIDDVIAGAPLWSRTPAQHSWEGAATSTCGGAGVRRRRPGGAEAGRAIRIEGEQAEAPDRHRRRLRGRRQRRRLRRRRRRRVGVRVPGPPERHGRAARASRTWCFGSPDCGGAGPSTSAPRRPRVPDRRRRTTPEYDHLGYKVTGVGDLDRDGRDDIAVMANTADTRRDAAARTTASTGSCPARPGARRRRQRSRARAGRSTVLARLDARRRSGQGNDIAASATSNGDGAPTSASASLTATAFGRSTAGAPRSRQRRHRGGVDLADAGVVAVRGRRRVRGPPARARGQRRGRRQRRRPRRRGDRRRQHGGRELRRGVRRVRVARRRTARCWTAPTSAAGATASSARPASSTGYAVAASATSNGDGYDDLVVGAYGADRHGAGRRPGVGRLRRAGPGTLPANDSGSGLVPANAADRTRYDRARRADARAGPRVDGQTAGERFGRQVADVGDVDGNGAPTSRSAPTWRSATAARRPVR